MRATLPMQCGRFCLNNGPAARPGMTVVCCVALTLRAHRSQVIEALLDGAFAPGAPHGTAEAHVAMLALATAAIDDRRACWRPLSSGCSISAWT
jgi:hypothetical protein